MAKEGNPDVPLTATTTSDPSTNDDTSRCAVCAWPLADSAEKGCVRGNCSLRPTPERWYAPDRAAAEGYGEYARRARVAVENAAASSIGRTLALQAGRPGSTPGAATNPLKPETRNPLHLELLGLQLSLMRFNELNAGMKIRTNVVGVAEIINAVTTLIDQWEALGQKPRQIEAEGYGHGV